VAQSVPITRVMKLKVVTLAVASVVAVAGFSGSAAMAQSSGDGGPPKTLAQCKKRVKEVDKALVWETKRYAKEFAKLAKERNALTKQAAPLEAQQATIQARITAIDAILAVPSDESHQTLIDEYNALIETQTNNARALQTITDELDGLKFEFSEAKKLHNSNVRSTVKYRKQVAAYCKKKF
jgi:hypothetical protein